MKRMLVVYALLEALLAALFGVVFVTQGLSVWAYWALAGVFVLSLAFGVALLRGGKGKDGQ